MPEVCVYHNSKEASRMKRIEIKEGEKERREKVERKITSLLGKKKKRKRRGRRRRRKKVVATRERQICGF